MSERPVLIQEWMDGLISTEDALFIAYASRDIRLTVWADFIVGAMVVSPRTVLRAVSCV